MFGKIALIKGLKAAAIAFSGAIGLEAVAPGFAELIISLFKF